MLIVQLRYRDYEQLPAMLTLHLSVARQTAISLSAEVPEPNVLYLHPPRGFTQDNQSNHVDEHILTTIQLSLTTRIHPPIRYKGDDHNFYMEMCYYHPTPPPVLQQFPSDAKQ